MTLSTEYPTMGRFMIRTMNAAADFRVYISKFSKEKVIFFVCAVGAFLSILVPNVGNARVINNYYLAAEDNVREYFVESSFYIKKHIQESRNLKDVNEIFSEIGGKASEKNKNEESDSQNQAINNLFKDHELMTLVLSQINFGDMSIIPNKINTKNKASTESNICNHIMDIGDKNAYDFGYNEISEKDRKKLRFIYYYSAHAAFMCYGNINNTKTEEYSNKFYQIPKLINKPIGILCHDFSYSSPDEQSREIRRFISESCEYIKIATMLQKNDSDIKEKYGKEVKIDFGFVKNISLSSMDRATGSISPKHILSLNDDNFNNYIYEMAELFQTNAMLNYIMHKTKTNDSDSYSANDRCSLDNKNSYNHLEIAKCSALVSSILSDISGFGDRGTKARSMNLLAFISFEANDENSALKYMQESKKEYEISSPGSRAYVRSILDLAMLEKQINGCPAALENFKEAYDIFSYSFSHSDKEKIRSIVPDVSVKFGFSNIYVTSYMECLYEKYGAGKYPPKSEIFYMFKVGQMAYSSNIDKIIYLNIYDKIGNLKQIDNVCYDNIQSDSAHSPEERYHDAKYIVAQIRAEIADARRAHDISKLHKCKEKLNETIGQYYAAFKGVLDRIPFAAVEPIDPSDLGEVLSSSKSEGVLMIVPDSNDICKMQKGFGFLVTSGQSDVKGRANNEKVNVHVWPFSAGEKDRKLCNDSSSYMTKSAYCFVASLFDVRGPLPFDMDNRKLEKCGTKDNKDADIYSKETAKELSDIFATVMGKKSQNNEESQNKDQQNFTKLADKYNIKRVSIIASGAMSGIPFGMLIDDRDGGVSGERAICGSAEGKGIDLPSCNWMVKNYTMTYYPTISSYKQLRNIKNKTKEEPSSQALWYRGIGGFKGVKKFSMKANQCDDIDFVKNKFGVPSRYYLSCIAKTVERALIQGQSTQSQQGLGAGGVTDIDTYTDGDRRENGKLTPKNFSSAIEGNAKIVQIITHGLPSVPLAYKVKSIRPSSDSDQEIYNKISSVGPALMSWPGTPIMMRDIIKGKIENRAGPKLFIMTACETATRTNINEPDPYGGLAFSLLYAGAESVMVGFWSEIQEPAILLMGWFMEDLIKKITEQNDWVWGPAEALQNAQIRLLNYKFKDNKTRNIVRTWPGTVSQSWSHPFFWAPYGLVN